MLLRGWRCLLLCVVPTLFVLLQIVFAAYVMQITHQASAEDDTQHLETEQPLVEEPAALAEHARSSQDEHVIPSFDRLVGEEEEVSAESIARKERELAALAARLPSLDAAQAEAEVEADSPDISGTLPRSIRLASVPAGIVSRGLARLQVLTPEEGAQFHLDDGAGRAQPEAVAQRAAPQSDRGRRRRLSPLPQHQPQQPQNRQPQEHLAPRPLSTSQASTSQASSIRQSEEAGGGADASRLRGGLSNFVPGVKDAKHLLQLLRNNATLALDAVLAQELRWDFGPSEVDAEALELYSCLGKGSYGMVFDGSVRGSAKGLGRLRVVVKVPTIRHWGFRFYRTELNALHAVQAVSHGSSSQPVAGASQRNVVRLLGNSSISVARLMALDTSSKSWSCVNRTDLYIALEHGARTLPAMLLEPLSNVSVFKWLASVAAPSKEGVSLSLQRRFYKMQYAKATAAGSEFAEAFTSAYDVLIGFARGIALLHSLHLVHRDLTEPGKNVLLRRDAFGLTSTIIDLSQAQRCPAKRGAAARSVDMYAFGHVLYFACYGRVVRGLPWTKFSCNGSPKALAELLPVHEEAHPAGRVSAAGNINRCSPQAQTPLHELMQYCWEPALVVARAHSMGVGVASRSARSNHSWEHVLERLSALRRLGLPMLKPT